MAPLIGISASQIHSGFVLGPHNSQIIITDDLVRNIKEETLYLAELHKGKLLNSSICFEMKMCSICCEIVMRFQEIHFLIE